MATILQIGISQNTNVTIQLVLLNLVTYMYVQCMHDVHRPVLIANHLFNICLIYTPGFLKSLWYGRLYVCVFVCPRPPGYENHSREMKPE